MGPIVDTPPNFGLVHSNRKHEMMSEFTSLISSQLSLRSTGCDARAHHTSIAIDVTREWSLASNYYSPVSSLRGVTAWSQSERKRETPDSRYSHDISFKFPALQCRGSPANCELVG